MPQRLIEIAKKRFALLCVLGSALLLATAAASATAETTITFVDGPTNISKAEPKKNANADSGVNVFAPSDLGTPQIRHGVTEKRLTFKTNKADKRTLRTAKTSAQLGEKKAEAVESTSQVTERMAAITDLLLEAQENEQRLRETINRRLTEQYKNGSTSDISFLLEARSISGLIDRTRTIGDQNKRDAELASEYQLSVDRLEQLELVLSELRDVQSERVELLDARINRLETQLVSAKLAHDEAPLDADAEEAAKAGAPGTWFVMDGAFQAQLFLPMPTNGGAYDGGTRTPRRAATPAEISTVLADPRIELTASGHTDIATGQIDGRILGAIYGAAQQFGHVRITSLKRDHGVYTTSGNVSAHAFGCAVDIGTIGKTFINASAQVPGGEVEQAVRYFASLPGDLAPHQVISLFSFGGATLSMGDHHDHIHVGYSC